MGYVFDTNAFNRLLDDETDVKRICSGIAIYASHIQRRELEATNKPERRAALLEVFREVTSEVLPTESMVFPIEFGAAKFGDGSYESIRAELDAEVSELKRKKRKKKEKGHSNDAQIAEVAIKNSYTLVTDDSELRSVVIKRGAQVIDYDSFKDSNT